MPARAARRGEDAINRSLYRRMTLIAGNAERLAEIGGAEEENIDSWRGGERLDIVDHRAVFDMNANNETVRFGEIVREPHRALTRRAVGAPEAAYHVRKVPGKQGGRPHIGRRPQTKAGRRAG